MTYLDYDPEADAAFVMFVDKVGPGEVVREEVCKSVTPGSSIILEFDSEDHLISF